MKIQCVHMINVFFHQCHGCNVYYLQVDECLHIDCVVSAHGPAICGVVMHGIPRSAGAGCEPSLQISVRHEEDHEEYALFQSKHYAPSKRITVQEEVWRFMLNKHVPDGVRAAGDIKV